MGLSGGFVTSRGQTMINWLQGRQSALMAVRAEKILVVAAVVVRGTFVVQISTSLLPEGPAAVRRSMFYSLSLFLIAESVALAAYMLRRGRYVTWAAVTDAAIVTALVVIEPFCVRTDDVVGTWVSWGYAAAIAAAVPTAIGVRRWRIVLSSAVVLGVAYLVGVLIHPVSHNAQVTAITNAFSVLGMSVACRLGGGFVREMGHEADRAREFERTLLHDYAPVLHLLSTDISDPNLKESAMDAAGRGARLIRSVLADSGHLPTRDRRGLQYLQTVIEGVCREFADLPLVRNLELLDETAVDDEVAVAVADAVRTLLWNVRQHAGARHVTVHGDQDDAGRWAVTIADDGVGFDPAAVTQGWGLRVQAGSALTRIGIAIDVDSRPGDGTRVQIRSAVDAVAGKQRVRMGRSDRRLTP